MRLAEAMALALALLACGCVDEPLDGAPGGALGNAVSGYAPGPGWEARVQARDHRTGRFVAVPLYDGAGLPTDALASDAAPADESVLLTPENGGDVLHRFAGFYDLPAWAWRDDRAEIRVQLRAPGSTAYGTAFAYTKEAYHGCLLVRLAEAFDLRDLGAHCSDREALTILRSPSPHAPGAALTPPADDGG